MANNNKKYISLNRLSNFLDNLKNTFALLSHKHTVSDLTDYKVDTALSSTSTNPVQNKVLNDEFNAIATAMNALEAAIDTKSDSGHNHDSDYDEKGAAAESLASAKSYTDTKIANLASTAVVENKISEHNTSASAHDDIRELIGDLETAIDEIGKRKEVYVGQDVPTDSYVQLWIDTSDLPSTSLSNFEEVYF